MSNKMLSRIISIGILAIIAASVIHIAHTKEYQIGREAYLAKEATNYDHHFAHPDSIAGTAIASLFFISAFYAVYELIAFLTLKVLERINADDSKS